MQIARPSSLVFSLLIAVILSGAAAFIGAQATPWGAGLGLVPLVVLAFTTLRRPLRRWRTARRRLPEADLRWLEEHVAVYAEAGPADRKRFARDVRFILDEWTFEGVGGAEVTDRLCLMVAAGAALMLHGRPDWELPARHTVLFYPGTFADDYQAGEDAGFDGMAHAQGPVILTVDAVEAGWARRGDGNNVVLHELAHLLDYGDAFADGTPTLVDPASAGAWHRLVRREMQRVKIGRSLLRSYAATNPAEFFAVAVENFFDRPERLAARHPALYRALVAFFALDPAPDALPEDADEEAGAEADAEVDDAAEDAHGREAAGRVEPPAGDVA